MFLRHREDRRKLSRPTLARRGKNRGAAMVEMVMVLPVLAFVAVASTDFARAFHDLVTITDCARNGSLFASMNANLSPTNYQSGIQSASRVDASNLTTTPTVSYATGSSGTQANYVDVTVSSQFQTLITYPGIPNQTTISRTIRMRVTPTSYRMQ